MPHEHVHVVVVAVAVGVRQLQFDVRQLMHCNEDVHQNANSALSAFHGLLSF
jgi:hypothetical protein